MNIKISCVIAFEDPTPDQIERIQKLAKSFHCRTVETPNILRVMFEDHDTYMDFLGYADYLVTESGRLELNYFN
jgi:hypothetical protein